MEIKSSLLNEKDFDVTRKSILAVSKYDNKQDFRVDLIEYINDVSNNNDDVFFYNQLECTLFVNPFEDPRYKDAIAFTNPQKLIYLNAPHKVIGEDVNIWEFIYDHECLHQLWDTFGVENKIQKEGKPLNREVMNIASDCVINDYLAGIRKKKRPPVGIFPDILEKDYGVVYDRKNDTQYTLYFKLMEVEKQLAKDNYLKDQTTFQGKIKVKTNNDDSSAGIGQWTPPHSDDYKKGWRECIQAVLDLQDKLGDKFDTKSVEGLRKSSSTKNPDYVQGWNDCVDTIINGLENGVSLSKDGGGGGQDTNDLADIPWDTPQQSSDDQNQDSQGGNDGDSDDSDKDSDDQNSSGNSSGTGKDAKTKEDAEQAAGEAQKAADDAQDAADAAKAAGAKDADEKQDAADEAAKAASEAKDAAEESKEAAANGDKNGEEKAAKKAADAAERAKSASNKATGKSDKKGKSEQGKSEKGQLQKSGNGGKGRGKSGHGDDNRISAKELMEKAKIAEDNIREMRNKLSGAIGDFIAKCQASLELKESGLAAPAMHAAKGWNTVLNNTVMRFVKNKVVKLRQQKERSWNRLRRGSGFVKWGAPILPGKKVKDQTMTINVGLYIDRSGSMGGRIEEVFKACYVICEALKKDFGRNKVVDDVTFKIFGFDTQLYPIEYGKKMSAGGCTMSFDELFDHIEKNTKEFLINIIITDAESPCDRSTATKTLDELPGMVAFVTNGSQPEVKALADSNKFKTKLHYIQAKSDFSIDK